ncbi:MAG TPA: GNAT family N-acetyltransferase [Thermoanaerobaculia bacterium]|nr:GNAT family N-acetyltransferase [Thermoanaerobaculia bacterium]
MTLRPARPEEAPLLTEIAHAAKRHWGYPESWIAAWREALTITPELLARQVVVVAEEEGAVRGFYALLPAGALWLLEHLWVRPERIGSGLGRTLFADAVRAARAGGGAVLEIEADPHAEGFYHHMGARRIGEVPADMEGTRRALPRLRLELGAA